MKKPRITPRTSMLGLERSPLDYADVVLIRWPWVLVPMVLATLLAGAASQFVPKQYRSRTVVMVETELVPNGLAPRASRDESNNRLLTVGEEVLARSRVERVLDELNPYPELGGTPRASLVDRIRGKTSVQLIGMDAFAIEYTDTDPKRAQQLANRLASLFIEEATGAREREAQGANDFIERQLEETRTQLQRHQESLSSLKQRYMGMLPEQLGANLSTLQRLQLDRQSTEEAIRSAKDRKTMLERQLATQVEMEDPEFSLLPIDDEALLTSPQLGQLQAQLTALRSRYTDEHPEVRAVMARIQKLEQEKASSQGADGTAVPSESLIVSEIKAQIQAVETDISNLVSREGEAKREIERYQSRVEMIPKVEEDLQTLERDYSLVNSYYSQLLSKKLEAETASAVEKRWKGLQFRILDPAHLPETPVYPRLSMFLGMGFLMGLGAGVALVFAVEFLDHSIKDTEELRALLPFPLLISIPHIPKPNRRARKRAIWKGGSVPPHNRHASRTRIHPFKEKESA